MNKYIPLNCTEAKQICDKNQYHEASLWQKIILSMHVLFCSICKKYLKQNKKLTKTIKKANLQNLTHAEKTNLQQTISSFKKQQ